MGKKDKRPKKTSPKRERYSKFRKEKSSALLFFPPDLPEDVIQQRRFDERRIDEFWRHYRRPPQRFILERKAKSKR